jgi:hypothetical protein
MDQESNLEALAGQAMAHQMLLTQMIWEWTRRQSHPPTALAGLLRPVEEHAAELNSRETLPAEYRASLAETVQGMARVLAETLERQALLRAEPKGPAS